MSAVSKLNAPRSSSIAIKDVAIATKPKSDGASRRASIIALTKPRLRFTTLSSTIQTAPTAILRLISCISFY